MRIAGAVEEELLRAMYQAAPVPRATRAAAMIVPMTLKTPIARAGQRTELQTKGLSWFFVFIVPWGEKSLENSVGRTQNSRLRVAT